MKGVWLGASHAKVAMGTTEQKKFVKITESLKTRPHGKWPQYFVPFSLLQDKYKDFYKNDLIEEPDEESQQVEDVLGDVTTYGMDLTEALKQAKLEKTKVETQAMTEKLQARKEELWSEWNEAFFEEFSQAFAKFKNSLIELRLTDSQLKTLEEKLDAAVNSMQDRLDSMLTDFMAENENKEEDIK